MSSTRGGVAPSLLLMSRETYISFASLMPPLLLFYIHPNILLTGEDFVE